MKILRHGEGYPFCTETYFRTATTYYPIICRSLRKSGYFFIIQRLYRANATRKGGSPEALKVNGLLNDNSGGLYPET